MCRRRKKNTSRTLRENRGSRDDRASVTLQHFSAIKFNSHRKIIVEEGRLYVNLTTVVKYNDYSFNQRKDSAMCRTRLLWFKQSNLFFASMCVFRLVTIYTLLTSKNATSRSRIPNTVFSKSYPRERSSPVF